MCGRVTLFVCLYTCVYAVCITELEIRIKKWSAILKVQTLLLASHQKIYNYSKYYPEKLELV